MCKYFLFKIVQSFKQIMTDIIYIVYFYLKRVNAFSCKLLYIASIFPIYYWQDIQESICCKLCTVGVYFVRCPVVTGHTTSPKSRAGQVQQSDLSPCHHTEICRSSLEIRRQTACRKQCSLDAYYGCILSSSFRQDL